MHSLTIGTNICFLSSATPFVGFFYFVMHCPDDYPHNPPRVRLMTTGGGSVRFNPNLYPNGKVCLRSVRSS